jgi:hypothetical protein
LITRNWPIKLAALFLAVMLYVAVAAQQPITQRFALRVVVLVPRGRALLEPPPGVSVLITGKGSELLKLRTFPRIIHVSVPDTLSTSSWRVSLGPSDVEVPKGVDVRVSEMTPGDLLLVLDSVSRKDVRIVPLITVVPDSGQVLRAGLSITPSVARLVGSDRALAAIESVTTIPTRISSVTGAFSQAVPIDTAPLGTVRIAPKQVQVTGEIGAIHERSFAGIPVESGAGGFSGFEVVPDRVSVAVRGPDDVVQALTRERLKVIAHIVGPAADRAWARLTVIAPTGITARAIPDSVALRKKRPARRG